MKTNFKRLSLLAALLGALTLNIAIAGETQLNNADRNVIAVPYQDLNLANKAGLDQFYARIRFAARRVCGVENMRVSLDIERNERACVASAMNKAIEEINDSRLTALHEAMLLEDRHS